eukprot:CAMPEP_0202902058 /NCGR_PEP_ID=MMETSP1392-20130828/16133_1 /ASSEMBLY_ACC=CAM_ASM_000868 /TAXON_ID=225041 /ORGANISM="Chlamydomonas chlamydogama, Strain SAG 11-48b" /LENGTH=98 /DNA_ID=CAMNT_0049588741 /DNA_START=14 /DNA_END=307 /DNA_ORIENTATION=-
MALSTAVPTAKAIRPALSSRGSRFVPCAAKNTDAKGKKVERVQVDYGSDWYEQTRKAASPRFRTVREELEYRRQANLAANNGRERKDLYTDNWDGSEW